LIPFLGRLKHASYKRNVFLDGHSVVVPPDIARVTEAAGQSVDLGHRGMEWEGCKFELGVENFVVTPLEVY
jgi:hypothetical protein